MKLRKKKYWKENTKLKTTKQILLQLYVSFASTFFRSDSPKTTLNCRLGSESTQPRFLPTKFSTQCAAVTTHSLLSKDPPQKMEPSWGDWSPTCHGQFWMEVTLPPTIRLEGSLALPSSNKKENSYFISFMPGACGFLKIRAFAS